MVVIYFRELGFTLVEQQPGYTFTTALGKIEQ